MKLCGMSRTNKKKTTTPTPSVPNNQTKFSEISWIVNRAGSFFYSIKCFTMYSKLLYHIGFVVLNFPKHATCLLLLFLNARIFIRLHTTRVFQQWKRKKKRNFIERRKKKIARRTQNVLCTYCICMFVVLCLSSNSRAAGHFNRILSSDALS